MRALPALALTLTMLFSVAAANATIHKRHHPRHAATTDQQKQAKMATETKPAKESGKPAAAR